MKYFLIVLVLLVTAVLVFFYHQCMDRLSVRKPLQPLDPDMVPEKYRDYIAQSKNALDEVSDAEIEKLEVISYDGLKLAGTLYRLNPGTKKVAIGFHGYHAWGLRDMGRFAAMYRRLGMDYLIVSQRNHHESEGKYTTFGCKESLDAVSWAEKIIEMYGDDVQIILHGVSMGGATVLMASALPQLPSQVKGIVEDCGYSSMYRESDIVLQKDYGKPLTKVILFFICLFGRIFSGCTIRDAAPVDVVYATRIPALMIHGEMDDYVPAFMLQENAAAYGGEYETYTVAAAGHADSFVKEPEEYERRVKRFTEKVLSQENEK